MIPVLGCAGNLSILAFNPVCIPMPSVDIFLEIVYRVKIDINYLYKNVKNLYIQLMLQQNTASYFQTN